MTKNSRKTLVLTLALLFLTSYALGASCSTKPGGLCEGYDGAFCFYDLPGGSFQPGTDFCTSNVRLHNFFRAGDDDSDACAWRDFACYCFDTEPCPEPFKIKDLQITTTTTSATLSWKSKWVKTGDDWPTNVTVYYGKTEDYGYQISEGDEDNQKISHTITLNDLEPGTTYHFSIQAQDSLDNIITENSTFTTQEIPNTPPTKPTPIEPTDGSTTDINNPLFRWNPSYDADGDTITYELQVDDDISFYSAITRATSSTQINEINLDPGTYYWKVRAYDGKDYSEWSDVWSFTIEEQDTTPPTSNHPPDITVEQGGDATIGWVLHDETAPGEYKVTKDGVTYIDWTSWEDGVEINVPVETNEIGTYQYTIYFKDAAGNEGTPDTVTVEVVSGEKPPSVPELTSPENGTSMYENPLVDWEESTDPNGDSITYELLIDNDVDFSSPEIHETDLTVTEYQTDELSTGTYYWKVRAYDGVEYSDWSEAWKFTITTKQVPHGFLTESPSGEWSERYPTQTTVSCTVTDGDDDASVKLLRNGEVVALGENPSETAVLRAGTYEYSCYYPETENYAEAVLDTKVLSINKAERSIEVTFDKESPITYGTPLTVNCIPSAGQNDGQISLFINETDITEWMGEEHVYPAGHWIFTCNISEGDNYTAATNSDAFIINQPNEIPVATILYPENNTRYKTLDHFNFTVFDDNTFELICNYSVDGGEDHQINAENGTITTVPVSITETGKHVITVRCFDGEEWSEPSVVNFSIDSIKPYIWITSPENNTRINMSIITYTGSDNVGINHYEVSKDDGEWIDNGLETSYEFALDEGEHTLCVRAVDEVGNTNESCVTIIYDITKPDITIESPENLTVFGTNEITITYSSNSNDLAYSQYKVDGGEWNIDEDGSPTTIAGLTEGWHYIYIRDVDLAGNVGPAQVVYVRVDTIRPMVIIESPENQSEYDTDWVVVDFKSSDEDVEGFEYSLDTLEWIDMGIEEPQPGETYSHNFTELPEGTNTIYVRAYDGIGSGKATLLVINVNIPNIPPNVTITYPTNNTYYQSVYVLKFTPIDERETTLVCNYSIDSGAWQQVTATNGNGNDVPISIDEGYHEARVVCFDGKIWSNESMVYFYVDTTAPTVTITSPENYSYQQEAHFEYMGSDHGGIGVDHYEVKMGDGEWMQTTETSYIFEASDGQHWLYVRAVDKLGYTGPIAKVVVNVDTQPPDIVILDPPNNTNLSGGYFDFFYTSNAPDLDHYEVKQDNGEWINKGMTDWAAFDDISEGRHYFYVKAVDWAGNERISYVYANFNTHGPKVVITSPSNGSYYEVDDINVTFYSNDSDIVTFQYSFNGVDWFNTGINAQPDVVYNYTVHNVPEGNSSIYIRGKDTVGYYGAPDVVNVTVDSIFTNLVVWIDVDDEVWEYSEENQAFGIVGNNNEETIPFGDIELNITFNDSICYLTPAGDSNPVILDELEGGDMKDAEWIFACDGTIDELAVNATVWMTYFTDYPNGKVKHASKIIHVLPL